MFGILKLLLDLIIDIPKQLYRGLNAVFCGDCVIDGVTLPPRGIFGNWQYIKLFFTFTKWMISTRQLFSLVLDIQFRLPFLHGKPKTQEVLGPIQQRFVDKFVKHKKYLPNGYQHFAVNLDSKTLLVAFIQSNPFFASALKAVTVDKNGVEYHIKAYDVSGRKEDRNWFSRFSQTYNYAFHRVNVVFDANFRVKSFEVYELNKEKTVATLVKGVSEEEAMGKLLFMLGYHFQCVHTLIHIFHTLLVSGLVNSSRNSTALAAFADRYDENIYLKYMEVKVLLLAPDAGLTGKSHNGDRKELLEELGELMKVWGSCESAQQFLEKFLLRNVLSTVDRKTLAKSNILTEFFKHVDLLDPFSTDLVKVFKSNLQEYEETERDLKTFLANTGKNGPQITNLKTWIELMGITGIIHGTTLSATRLLASIPVLKYFFQPDKFDTNGLRMVRGDDAETIKTLLGTIVGIQDEKHVFSDDLRYKPDPLIRAIEARYGGLSAGYKLDYFNEIKDKKEFKQFGWLWTDYCPDMIDSKQFTIDTYV